MEGKSEQDCDEERNPYSAPLLLSSRVEWEGGERNPYYVPNLSNSRRDWDREKNPYSDPKQSNPTYSPPMGSVEIKDEEEDEEFEPGSAASCRICLEHNGDSGEELISPCKCKGTHQFVHRSCLDHWRSVKEGFAFSHCTTCRAQYHLRINFVEGTCWRNIKFRMFVTRDVLLVFLAVQTILAVLGGLTYLFDLDGSFRKSFDHGWDRIFSNHPILFYYCLGALVFLVLLGFFGLLLQCSSYGMNNSSGHSHSSSTSSVNCCYGPCVIDSSGEEFFALVLIFVIVFAVIGIFYGIFAGTIGIQRIWQKHYHILTKRELTKEYVVEDLHGCYTPPRLDREHAERLRLLNLL